MNLALFDFDGTITNKDMYTSFLKFSVTKIRFVFVAVLFYSYTKLAGYQVIF